eukprot:scaffold63096_cov53-Phaeocystis_antarctica.AAC.2
MVVTLGVLKLSGWLNAVACCRVARGAPGCATGGHAVREEVRPGMREGVGLWRSNRHVHTVRARLKAGGQGTRGAHPEHVVHVRDAGRVEAERLVERRRGLPSRKAGMRCGKRCGPGGVRALGGGDAIGMCTGRARL